MVVCGGYISSFNNEQTNGCEVLDVNTAGMPVGGWQFFASLPNTTANGCMFVMRNTVSARKRKQVDTPSLQLYFIGGSASLFNNQGTNTFAYDEVADK